MNIINLFKSNNEDPSNITLTSQKLEEIQSIPSYYILDNKTMNYKLSDFYITGSYNSYTPMGGTLAYNSLNQIRNVLIQGARFLKLDVYDNNFSLELNNETIGFGTEPYIRGKKPYKIGDYQNNALKLGECFSIIKEYAWDTDHNLPLIIYLDLKYDKYNIKVSNKIGNYLKSYFWDYYPDKKYCFYRYKLGNEDIHNFLKKIIIFTSRENNGKFLDEMTHGILYKDVPVSKFIQGYSYSNILNNRGKPSNKFLIDKLKRKSKEDLVILFPENEEKKNIINPFSTLYNFNINNLAETGINIILMNYSLIDNNLNYYQIFFKTGGFKIKPNKLLNKNISNVIIRQENKRKNQQPIDIKPVNKYGPNIKLL